MYVLYTSCDLVLINTKQIKSDVVKLTKTKFSKIGTIWNLGITHFAYIQNTLNFSFTVSHNF